MHSDKAFELYLTALVKNGLESSVNAAVRRRDGILASVAAIATPSAPAESTPATETPLPATETSAPASQPTPVASRSESIAHKILAGGAPNTPTGPVKVDSAQFAAALAGGAGVSGNPIHVTLAECEP